MNSLKLHKIDHFTVVNEEDVQCAYHRAMQSACFLNSTLVCVYA